MRVLVITPFPPDVQARHGGGIYLGLLCQGLARKVELGLVALTRRHEQLPAAAPFSWHSCLPLAGQEPAERGVRHKLKMAWRWGPGRQPLVVAKHWQPDMPAALAKALAEFQPDVALVEQASMAQYLPWLRSVPTVLTDHEAGVPDRVVTDLGAWADRRDLRLWRRFVRHFYPMASAVQVLTTEDAARVQGEISMPVGLRCPAVPVPATAIRADRAPPHMLFLGDYRHHPNPEAVRRLVASVLPEVRRRLPAAELLVAGPNQDRLADLAAVPGVRLLGYANDLTALLASARCLLAPVYSGGGLRTKVLTALAHGLPVVTNALGARGPQVPEPARIVVEDDAGLAAAALRFLREPELARTAGELAHDWARDRLGPDAVAREQLDAITRLLATRQPVCAPPLGAAPVAQPRP